MGFYVSSHVEWEAHTEVNGIKIIVILASALPMTQPKIPHSELWAFCGLTWKMHDLWLSHLETSSYEFPSGKNHG